jgi:hypothetical protein
MTKQVVPTRIGNDVYIRDNEDPTVQMKAKVYETHYAEQVADVGFYPEREGQPPAMLQLPDAYRAQIPLPELSLTPHAGARQIGYAEALMAAGVDPATLTWIDNIGATHAYGPDALKQVVGTEEVPEFDEESLHSDTAHAETASRITTTSHAKQWNEAHVEPAPVVDPPAKPTKAAKAKPVVTTPMFSKAEMLTKLAECEHVTAQLRRMVEAMP